MKRFFTILAVLAAWGLVAPAAMAGNNIKQKGDGTTVWQSTTPGNSGQEVPVGPGFYSATITDITRPVTTYMTMPFAGVIKSVYTVVGGTIATAATVLNVYVGGGNGQNNATWTKATDGSATTGMSIASGATAGTTDSITFTSANTFTAGQVIAIHTDGASTISAGHGGVGLTVTVAPR